jgi:hypothetical protein
MFTFIYDSAHLVVVDERFDGVDQSFAHLVDLVEDEEGLRTVCDVASNPVLQIKLMYDKQSIKTFLKNYFLTKHLGTMFCKAQFQKNRLVSRYCY